MVSEGVTRGATTAPAGFRVECTTEQLLALSTGLQFDDPMFLRHPPIVDWPEKVRTEVELLGVRSLLARGLVATEGGSMRVPTVLRDVVAALCQPTAVATVGRLSSAATMLARMYTSGDGTTMHQPVQAGNHRLAGVQSDKVLPAAIRLSGLRGVEAADAKPVTIDQAAATETFKRLQSAGESGTPFDSTGLAISEETFEALSVFSTDFAVGSITVVRNVNSSVVEGIAVSWVDDPSMGQWLVEPVGESIVLTPTSGDDILAEVRSGYGDAEGVNLGDDTSEYWRLAETKHG